MKEFQHSIKDELGLHARPCGMLVKEAKKYKSKITITFGEKKADAKGLLGVMTLGVKHGDAITITIEGEDEDPAFEELQNFCSTNV